MTSIAYIHGMPIDERRDRSKQVRAQKFIDYSRMSEGEARLHLMRRQIQIFADYYSDNKDLRNGLVQLEDYLHDGIGMKATPSRYLLPFVQREIDAARRLQKAAISGIIPIENCNQYDEMGEDPYGELVWMPTDESIDCAKRNYYKKLINEHLEGSAHHLLYHYVLNPNQETATVASKKVWHDLAIEELHKITGLSRSNLKLWIRNGIIANNASKPELGAWQPELTFQKLKAGASAKVSAIDPITLTVLVKLFITAVVAVNKLVNDMKNKDREQIKNVAKGIGSTPFGPQETDVKGGNQGGSGGNGSSSNNMLPLLLVGAAMTMK